MANVNRDFYRPATHRKADSQYKALLNDILDRGHFKDSVQGIRALTVLGATPMRFRLANGVPLITERNLALKPRGKPALWRQSIAEIIAYINGAHTLRELESFGCFWWDRWATDEKCKAFGLAPGELGSGFYGEAFARFPGENGVHFNQIAEVIEQIKTNPMTRTHFISPWIPQRLIGKHRRSTITPCAGWMYFEVYDEKISLCMTQRAGDVPIGVPFNSFQYAALLLMVAQVTNLMPHEFVHAIIDAHIYENQMLGVTSLLSRESRPFPVLEVNPDVDDIFKFRMDDFTLSEYDPHPAVDIPVSI